MKANCLLCQKNKPSIGRFCQTCADNYKAILYDGDPASSLYERYQYIDFHEGKICAAENPRRLRFKLFLSRNLPRLSYADERTLSYGFVVDLDIDASLNILNFICLLPHSSLLKTGEQYAKLLRKHGSKKIRHIFMGNSGDFIRMSTDFIRYEDSLGATSGHSGFIGGEYSAFTLVSIPYNLFDSFMISSGGDLYKGWLNRDHYQKTLQKIYQHMDISIMYISTKISPNLIRNEFEKLLEDPTFEFKKGFIRAFISNIINENYS